jgi:hypothetical protein
MSFKNKLNKYNNKLQKQTGGMNQGNDRLIIACNSGNLLNVRNVLRDPTTNIDFQDNNGKTALMIAIQNGNEDIMEELLIFGADFYIKDKTGVDVFDLLKNATNDMKDKFNRYFNMNSGGGTPPGSGGGGQPLVGPGVGGAGGAGASSVNVINIFRQNNPLPIPEVFPRPRFVPTYCKYCGTLHQGEGLVCLKCGGENKQWNIIENM